MATNNVSATKAPAVFVIPNHAAEEKALLGQLAKTNPDIPADDKVEAKENECTDYFASNVKAQRDLRFWEYFNPLAGDTSNTISIYESCRDDAHRLSSMNKYARSVVALSLAQVDTTDVGSISEAEMAAALALASARIAADRKAGKVVLPKSSSDSSLEKYAESIEEQAKNTFRDNFIYAGIRKSHEKDLKPRSEKPTFELLGKTHR